MNRLKKAGFILLAACIAVVCGCAGNGDTSSRTTDGKEDYLGELGTFEGLSAETERQIKLDFWNHYRSEVEPYWPEAEPYRPEFEPDLFRIKYYFGIYNDWVVMANVGYARAVSWISIDGYDFVFPSTPVEMFAWQNGHIYDVQEAFELGFLTRRDIKIMYERHNRGETRRAYP
jgi:hypothetical protein